MAATNKRSFNEISPSDGVKDESPLSTPTLNEWTADELRDFTRLTSDGKHLAKMRQLKSDFILKICARPLFHWKQDDLHPLLLCKCGVPMKCRYFQRGVDKVIMFGCCLWSADAAKKHQQTLNMQSKAHQTQTIIAPFCDFKLYEEDCRMIIERIEALLGRPSSVRRFFSPVAVRMAQHVGFGLVNHTPPFCDEKQWKLYDTLFRLDFKDDIVPDAVKWLQWSMVQDDPPIPSYFEGFRAPEAEIRAILNLISMLKATVQMELTHDKLLQRPCGTSEASVADLYASVMRMQGPHSLAIETVPLITKMAHEYDYIMHLGVRLNTAVKVWASWHSDEIVAIPLHGMGKSDLGFLYGSSQMILFYTNSGEKIQLLDTYRLRTECLALAASVPEKQYHEAVAGLTHSSLFASSIRGVNEEVMMEPVFSTDMEWHEHNASKLSCGPACISHAAADAMHDEISTPGDLTYLSLQEDVYRTSISRGKACDEYLIFKTMHFVNWCKLRSIEVDLLKM